MKAPAIVAALLGLSACAAWGQSAQTDILRNIPSVPLQNVERHIQFRTETAQRLLGLTVRQSGVLPQLARTDNPLQLINPFAPARYGDGTDNVVFNPVTNRPEGIALFSVRF
jgi:hypothetical protein